MRTKKENNNIGVAFALFAAAALCFQSAPAAESEATDLLKEARQAFQTGQRERAIEIATQMIESSPQDPNCYFLRARFYEMTDQRESALKDYDRLLEVAPYATEVLYHRAILKFLLGRIPECVADFELYAESHPELLPAQWQRGIALYFAGKYKKGAEQFELHRTVNPNDVENAVWHFLCLEKLKGLEAAREEMLQVTGDVRLTMPEIYNLFAGEGTPQQVLAMARSGNYPEATTKQHLLYAHLYLALYYESTGDSRMRMKELEKAVALELQDNYMWEVARVYRELIESGRWP